MRKILSILLTIVLLYSTIGFYIDFKIEQYLVKEEIKEKLIRNLPDNELTLIKITPDNKNKIRWTEEGEEFRYGDDMFDVARTKTINGTTYYYYCYNDEKESKLISSVDKLVKEQMDHSKSKNQNKKPVINYFFYKNVSETLVYCLLATLKTSKVIKTFDVFLDVLSPPPEA